MDWLVFVFTSIINVLIFRNLQDSRFLLTASHDSQILLSDPEAGELHGRIGAETGDWARYLLGSFFKKQVIFRSISWCPSQPDLIAVQYFQHPIQITHLQGFNQIAESEELVL